MKIKSNKKGLLIAIIYIIGIAAIIFDVNSLGYIDEMVETISLIYIVFRLIKKNNINAEIIITLNLLIALLFVGILGNLIFDLQYSYLYVFEDAFLFFKPYIIFIATILFLDNYSIIVNSKKYIQKIVKASIIILTIGLIVGLISKNHVLIQYSIWVPFPQLPYFVFFAKYPGLLAFVLGAFNMVILSEKPLKKNVLYLVLNIVLLFSTQSDTGLMFIVIDIIFLAVKLRHRVKIWQIVLIAAIGLIVGWNTITTYLLNPNAARSIMISNSVKTALKYFPIGSGFSTYGGKIAANQYSKLYLEYGYKYIWGLNGAIGGEVFLNDTFYPWVIAEFGFIGCFIYTALVIYLFYVFNKNQINRMPLMFGLLVLLISNFGQGGITSIVGMLIFIYMAILCQEDKLATSNGRV